MLAVLLTLAATSVNVYAMPTNPLRCQHDLAYMSNKYGAEDGKPDPAMFGACMSADKFAELSPAMNSIGTKPVKQ